MQNPKNIHIQDYSYDLPDERIAKFPLAERDASKLLIYQHGQVTEDVFSSLPKYLPSGALMVFNNTKVIQARLHFRKASTEGVQGALIEVFCLEPALPNDYQLNFSQKGSVQWYCLVGNLKKWKEGKLFREIEKMERPSLLPVNVKGCMALRISSNFLGTAIIHGRNCWMR